MLGVVLLAASGGLVFHAGQRYPLLLDRGFPQLPVLSRTVMIFPEFNDQPGLDQFVLELPRVTDTGLASTGTAEVRPGAYTVTVVLSDGVAPDGGSTIVRIVDHRTGTTLSRQLLPRAGGEGDDWLSLSFGVTELTEIRVDVESSRPGRVPVDHVVGRSIGPPPDRRQPVRRDVPLGLLWVTGTVTLACSTAEVADRHRRERSPSATPSAPAGGR